MVKEWLGIDGNVGRPDNEHPKRAIQGLNCTKNEVSGTRFWSLMRELCSSPEIFFKNCYVHNYCPLCFMAESGKNVTPPMLRMLERRHLEEICNQSLIEIMKLLEVEFVVGVGKYPEERAKAALEMARQSEMKHAAKGEERYDVCRNVSTCNQAGTSSTSDESLTQDLKLKSRMDGTSISEETRLTVITQSVAPSTINNPRTEKGDSVCGAANQCKLKHTLNEITPHLPPRHSDRHGNIVVYGLMHPSPINPAANKGWNQLATSKFSELDLLEIIKDSVYT